MKIHESIHVCFLTHEYPPGTHGGIGSFTQTLSRGLVKRGHRVTVVGNYPKNRVGLENDQGVRVIRIPKSPVPKTGLIINAMRIRKTLLNVQRVYNIDILEAPNLGLGFLSSCSPGTKILRIHTTISTDKGGRLLRSWRIRRSFSIADYVCAVSRFSAESNRSRLQLGSCHIEIIPNPVDTSFFHPKPVDKEKKGLILFVGTVCENKGVRQLIQAMPEIADAVPSAHLWVVGRDWNDPKTGQSFTARIRGLIPSRLDSHILFKGSVEHSEIPDIISKAQLCVYPSHMENMPVAWLEGMAMGKAIVASNTGPGHEVIADGASGLLCDPHNSSSIAEKVIKLLKDPDLRLLLGEEARKRAVKLFSLDVLVRRNEAFYRRCLENKAISATRGSLAN